MLVVKDAADTMSAAVCSSVCRYRLAKTQGLAALCNGLLQALANRTARPLAIAAGGKRRLICRSALGCLPGINPDKTLLAVQGPYMHPVFPDRDALGPEPLWQLQGCHLLRQRLLLLLASAVLDELALRFVNQTVLEPDVRPQ